MCQSRGAGTTVKVRRKETHVNARRAGVGALLFVAIGVGCLGYLQATSGIGGMVSDYGASSPGAVLLPAGMLAMAGALGLCYHGLVGAGATSVPTGALLLVAAVGLALMSGFSSDATGAPPSTRGMVHKTAAALLFCSLPAAALLLGRGFSSRPGWKRLARPMGRVGGAGVVTMVVFLATYLPGFGVPLPGGRLLTAVEGLAERAVLVPDLTLIVLLAVRLACVRPATAPSLQSDGSRSAPAPVTVT
jgi:hypothetical protein